MLEVSKLTVFLIQVQNPLDADLNIRFVQNDAGINGEVFAHFDQGFDTFLVPSHGTANSGTFGNVLLTKGAIASLQLLFSGTLDISSAITVE